MVDEMHLVDGILKESVEIPVGQQVIDQAYHGRAVLRFPWDGLRQFEHIHSLFRQAKFLVEALVLGTDSCEQVIHGHTKEAGNPSLMGFGTFKK